MTSKLTRQKGVQSLWSCVT